MAENILYARLQHAVEHTEDNTQMPANASVPLNGEIVFNSDRTNFKVGSGTTEYSSLSYILPEIPERCVIITPSSNSHLTDLYSNSLLTNSNASKFSVFEPSGTIKLIPDYIISDGTVQIFMLNLSVLNSNLINDVEYTFDLNMVLNNNSAVSNPDNILFVCADVNQNQYVLNYTDWDNNAVHTFDNIDFRGFQKSFITPSSLYYSLKSRRIKVMKHAIATYTYFFIY